MESGALLTTSRHSPVASGCLLGRDRVQTIALPYTVGLVILGLGLGLGAQNIEALESLRSLELSHELILLVFVPPLVFASAINIDLRLLIRSLLPDAGCTGTAAINGDHRFNFGVN